MSSSYEEVHVYDGKGERTGVRVDRKGVRGHRGVCRSVTELSAKSRRLGDGYYYIAAGAWPADATSVNLFLGWSPIG